ncbi:Fe2+-dicitrate sensor, membrane component [Bordetella flabilis]|uniref:Fe2+-dicitrate sensor, membrane component n=1 Tax=Bordetella flabilis TaxID=463014 RepID=A0A193GJZ6_9BORD|nr:FecR domain-containing protein [Bordetella flabilis]ANN80417.1 Fe2+-dicitrate sensor, membrane component [Bordetella flabilis]
MDAAAASPAGPPSLERGVARAAARWLLRLSSPSATDADVRACARWRASRAEHEQAWQRAQRINERFARVPAALGMAALDRPESRPRRTVLKALVALVAGGAGAWAAGQGRAREWIADYRSGVGEYRRVALDDGSVLELNTSTAVDVRFDARMRLLRLYGGEIAVHAVRDATAAGRPLLVSTRHGEIETEAADFDVRDGDARCQVQVRAGEVRIRCAGLPGKAVVVKAGQQGDFTASALPEAAPADSRVDGWTRGILYADRMPLADFAHELGRYRRGVLRCDPAVAGLRISGIFQLRDTDAALAALPATLPVRVRYLTPYWVGIGPAARA